MKKKKRVLVSPLNWGLGHASRCVPIIRELVKRDTDVIIAGEGAALQLLQTEFPNLRSTHLKGLKIRYPRRGSFTLHFALKLPMLFKLIRTENEQLKKIIEEHKIDGIISDNRYGLYSKKVPSVLITHQLFIQSPFLTTRLNRIVRKLTSRFQECWIPDLEGNNNLSGKLAHGHRMTKNTQYIGSLSRFSNASPTSVNDHILIVLSGPEPKRTQLEEVLVNDASKLNRPVKLVRGLVNTDTQINNKSQNLEVIDFLSAIELEQAIKKAALVVCRSGYSSVMDLVALRKKALLIPTKGQIEQEYLGHYLKEKNMFYCVNETNLNLERDVEAALNYSQVLPKETTHRFDFLDRFLEKL